MRKIYLDYNATAPLRPQAMEAMWCSLQLCGNPSAVHSEGRAARAAVEQARHEVARSVGALPDGVVFTSGGTEALNLALTPALATPPNGVAIDRLLVCATEHACVSKGHRFPADRVETLPVLTSGIIDLDFLERVLRASGRVMLALQLANNETGVVQPVRAAAELVHASGGIVVCDAVQAAGKIAVDASELGVDMIALSAHKLGGPKGAGALIVVGPTLRIEHTVLRGGGQERGMRAGTENVASIVGFGAAATAARVAPLERARISGLRDGLIDGLRLAAPDVVIFAEGHPRLPNTVAFAVPGLRAETVLIGLDLAGVAVSSGAACSSGKVARSHVLEAMGVGGPLLSGAIRLSLGWGSTLEDVMGFAAAIAPLAHARTGSRIAA